MADDSSSPDKIKQIDARLDYLESVAREPSPDSMRWKSTSALSSEQCRANWTHRLRSSASPNFLDFAPSKRL
jgi:hypothetical protein